MTEFKLPNMALAGLSRRTLSLIRQQCLVDGNPRTGRGQTSLHLVRFLPPDEMRAEWSVKLRDLPMPSLSEQTKQKAITKSDDSRSDVFGAN